jgi:hypothetical protein
LRRRRWLVYWIGYRAGQQVFKNAESALALEKGAHQSYY